MGRVEGLLGSLFISLHNALSGTLKFAGIPLALPFLGMLIRLHEADLLSPPLQVIWPIIFRGSLLKLLT